MFTAYVVVAVVLAAVLLLSAYTKLIRSERTVATLTKVGVTEAQFAPLATCEAAGALGLLAGLWVAPLGIAAAGGVALYFVGALGAHARVRDRDVAAPVVILALAVAALVLRIASA